MLPLPAVGIERHVYPEGGGGPGGALLYELVEL